MKKLTLILSLVIAIQCAIQCASEDEKPNITIMGTVSNSSGAATDNKAANSDSEYSFALVSDTPVEYKLAILKAAFVKDDGTERTIFDTISDPSNYTVVDVSEGQSTEIKQASLVSGSYTSIKITLMGLGQKINHKDLSGTSQTATYAIVFQTFDNTGGTLSNFPKENLNPGDFFIDTSTGFKWMSYNSGCDIEPDKLDFSTTGVFKVKDTSISAEQTVNFDPPLTIAEGKNYTITLTFGAKDTFSYDDKDSNNEFQPSGSDCYTGGTNMNYRIDNINGPDFSVQMPGITAASASD